MHKEFQKRILSSLILIPIILFFIIKGSLFFNFFILFLLLIFLYKLKNLSFKKIYYLPGFIFIFFILHFLFHKK